MASENEKDSKDMQKQRPASVRIEDEAVLREALEAARVRVKRLARRETESKPTDEEILHFRLKGGE